MIIICNIVVIMGMTKEPDEFVDQCSLDDPDSCKHVKIGGCCMEWTALNYEKNPVMKVKPLKTYNHCTPKEFMQFIEKNNGQFTMKDFSKMNFNFMKGNQKEKLEILNIHPKTTYEEFLPVLYK